MQYPTLLSGVSQQTPRERTNNQFTSQENMVSDPVASLRRRPPLVYKKQVLIGVPSDTNHIVSQYTEIGGKPVHLILSTYPEVTVELYDKEWNPVQLEVPTDVKEYLKSQNKKDIRVTNCNGITWILNTSKKPIAKRETTTENPKGFGYIHVKTGAFLKTYSASIIVYNADGGIRSTKEFEYTTPAGTESGDASKSTPEGVAKELASKINADSDLEASSLGGVVWLNITKALRDSGCSVVVKNGSGSNYAVASGAQTVSSITELPNELPTATGADGFIIGVGSSATAMAYYKYDQRTAGWFECGAWGGVSSIENMPVSLNLDDNGDIEIKTVPFEGRVSGDDENNPEPVFLTQPITGIGTYSGRLVVMCGPYVYLSASRYPTRFMRSSVASVLDSDPIEVAASSSSSASFEYAVQFNKDLVLFSKTHQAVIPAGNVALSPLTAMLVLTSQQPISTNAMPCVVGQTLMYATPMATAYTDYFGVGELVPSEYTNSVYTPQNLTEHLPRYMLGDCELIVSGGNTNVAVFVPSNEKSVVIAHEYLWSNNQRLLNSWSKWRFRHDVASVHMCDGQLYFVLADSTENSTQFLIGIIDPRTDATRDDGVTVRNYPYLDLYYDVPVVSTSDGRSKRNVLTCTLPDYMNEFQSGIQYLALASTVKGLYGEPVGIKSIQGSTITIDPSYNGDTITIGYTYKSFFEPNSPVIFSNTGETKRLISDTKDTLLRADLTLQKSGEFTVEVKDEHNTGYNSSSRTALLWSSKELGLGSQQINSVTDVLVPCRTNAHTTSLTISTEDTRELNVLGLVYIVNLHQRKGRKRL